MAERLVIGDFRQFGGRHCETAALRNVLDYHGFSLSEEMLLGLGGGIGFIYWYMKFMPCPFIGTRNAKRGELLKKASQRIGAKVEMLHTSSSKKGYEELKTLLRSGEPAICFGDMAYLPYFAVPEEAHFGAHTFVVFGIDEKKEEVYISDRGENPVTIGIEDLDKTRSSKHPPFPPKHGLAKIEYPSKIEDLKQGIEEGIRDCCEVMLGPPIKNLGLAGIQKWSNLVVKWPGQFEGMNLLGALMNSFIFIEIAGIGGSGFRSMYARFLKEASAVVNEPRLNEAAQIFSESAGIWSDVAKSLLPDSWPSLKKMRELILEKNNLFERQPLGALEKMQKINVELDDLMEEAVEDLQGESVADLLVNVQQNLLKVYEAEKRAFEELAEIVR